MRGAERNEEEPTRPNASTKALDQAALERKASAILSAKARASDLPVRVGDRLADRYEVTRIIGHGAMGIVVEARQGGGQGQRVAVKILHERHRESAEAVARFTQEGRAAARIRGEHSVRLYDVGSHDGLPFLVMELLSGQDLAGVMEDGPLPVDKAASYILQACEGIAEVHAHGMVHRDLKPSNLFLTERPDGTPLIKVLDFGIAKGVRQDGEAALIQTQTFIALGTPLYMSPEQIRASSEVDARADVWSLGTIFYELVAGRPAFGGNTVTNVTAQVLEKEPAPLSSVAPAAPAELDRVVQTALCKNADDRFIDVAALAAALEPFAGSLGLGSAGRAARILQGALRPDVITTPPVSRDEGLGGTIRFDRNRRARVLRALVACLAALTIVLVVLAAASYRSVASTSSEGRALARRGIAVMLARASDRIAPPAPVSSVERSTQKPAPPPAPLAPASAPAATATASAAPHPQPSGPRPPPPAKSAKPAASGAPYNPFSERN